MQKSTQTNEAVELLKRLIAIPSTSRDETAAADCLFSFLESKGLKPQRLGNNVWCVCEDYDPERQTILLNAHIDTVKPVAGWQHDPFTPTLEDDRLYGLGSNDCGGGLVSLLMTFIQLTHSSASDGTSTPDGTPSPWGGSGRSRRGPKGRLNLIYLASCEEEVSGKNGIEAVLKSEAFPRIDFAIVGEPTGMQPAIAEKGLMVIDAVARGKAGHAARNEGDNAIYHAIKDIQWLSQWVFPKQTELLGPVKNTVTIVNAGTQHNVIPDQCTFTIDVRSNECYTNEEIFEYLQAHTESELTARSFRLSSSRIDIDHPFVQLCIERGMKPFGSPTLSDQALMRFPSLKLGPGDSARSHTADEYIKLSEIDEAIALYTELLNSLSIKA